jgi:hypothetical protein
VSEASAAEGRDEPSQCYCGHCDKKQEQPEITTVREGLTDSLERCRNACRARSSRGRRIVQWQPPGRSAEIRSDGDTLQPPSVPPSRGVQTSSHFSRQRQPSVALTTSGLS